MRKVALCGHSGQTVIETILWLLFILLIIFFIVEGARAWYLKNSLNNAVRVAVRRAVVEPNLSPLLITNAACPSSNYIVNTVCASSGVPNSNETKVTVQLLPPDVGVAGPSPGDIISVKAVTKFESIVPRLLPMFSGIDVVSSAAMRYE